MLRGAGRIHRQHAKQALLSFGKRHDLLQTHRGPSHLVHLSCAVSSLRVLAVSKHHSRFIPPRSPFPPVREGYPLARLDPNPSLPLISHPPSPCRPPEHPGHYPSGIIHVIDAFSRATKDQIKQIVSVVKTYPEMLRYFHTREDAVRLAHFFASTSRPSRAQSATTLACALGCCFKPNHFESVVYHLSLKEHWSVIPPLVALARDQCGKTTTRLLNWKMRAFIECHRFARLDRVLEEFVRDGVQPTRRTFHLLISGHLRNQDLDSAKKSLERMGAAGFPVDESTHAVIVTAYRSLGLDPQVHARAFQALRHVDSQTSTRILNSIIQHLLDVGDEASAAEHLNTMMATVPVASASTVTHESGGTTTGADGVTSHRPSPSPPESSMVPPDAATFTILINYLNRKRQFRQVHKVLDRMVVLSVKPDAGVAAAVIHTYCLSGHDDTAASILATMLESDTDASDILSFFGVKRLSHLPIDVKGIDLNVHVFNAILPRILQIRGLGGARSLFRIMRSNGIQINATTIELFLNHLDRTEHIDSHRLIQVVRSMSRKIYGPTIRHFNVILRNALRREKHTAYGSGWDTTAAKFSKTRDPKPSPSEDCDLFDANALDPSGSRSHHSPIYSLLRPIIDALSRKGVNGDRATFAMWLKHESIADRTLDASNSLFRHMVGKGIHPNRYHFTILMDGYARAGDMHGAAQVMRSAQAAGFEPNAVMWTVLISGYARKGRPGMAMKTFREMVAAGVPPDVPAIDALAHAYFAVGAYLTARKVLLELWPRVKPFPSELGDAPLKQLARAFRQSDDSGAISRRPLTPQDQRSFYRNLRRILQEWKHAQEPRSRSED